MSSIAMVGSVFCSWSRGKAQAVGWMVSWGGSSESPNQNQNSWKVNMASWGRVSFLRDRPSLLSAHLVATP